MKQKLNIVIEKDDHGYYAYAPELKGCHTQANTFEEAMVNIKEAVELYIGTLSADELAEMVSTEIITTTMEVQVA